MQGGSDFAEHAYRGRFTAFATFAGVDRGGEGRGRNGGATRVSASEPANLRFPIRRRRPNVGGVNTLVALLRAVNVGGVKLPMADLRAMAEAAGYGNARTYIQSGNLVFTTADEPCAARAALEKRLEVYAGKPVGVIMRTAEQMRAVLHANPFPDAEPSKVGILFLDSPPPIETIDVARGRADEVLALGEREIFVHYPSGMGRSKLRFPALSQGTSRNVNTVRKLVEMTSATSAR